MTVTAGEASASKPVVVEEDPRVQIGAADRADRRAVMMRLYEMSGKSYTEMQEAGRLRTALTTALAAWRRPDAPKVPDEVRSATEALQKKAIELQEKFGRPPAAEGAAGPPLEVRPPTIPDRLSGLTGPIDEYTGPVTDDQKKEIDLVAKDLDEAATAIEKLVTVDLAELNKKISQSGIPYIVVR